MKKLFIIPIALAFAAFQTAAAVLPAEKLLPDDTLAMYTIPDVNKTRDIFASSPQFQLWSDPAMKPFKDKFLEKLKTEFLNPLEHDLGIHFDDYTSLPQGQFTVAVTQDGWQGNDKEGKSPAVLLLLDTRDKSPQLKTTLADLKKKWIDAGKNVKTEKIRDIEFSSVVISSNDIPKSLKKAFASNNSDADSGGTEDKSSAKPAPNSPVYIGQAESLLIMGNSPKAIEKVLAGMSGGAVKTLGDVPAFAASQAAMFRDAPVFGWVNAKALVGLFSRPDDSSSSADGSASFNPDKLLGALGLKGLKSVAFNYLVSNDGAQFNVMVNVPEDSRTGLFKILAGEPKEYNPPPFVPADAVKFQRWRIDGQKVWATLQQIVGDINPQTLNALNFMLTTAESSAKEKDPSFDIKKNLFGNLGDDVISYSKKPKGTSLAELGSPPSLFLLGSPNPEQLASALRSVYALAGAQTSPTERDFLGRKIYSIPLPNTTRSADGQPAPQKALNYACSGGYVAFSMDPGILEEYLRSSQGDTKSLRDAPGLNDASQKIGGSGTSLFGYSNESESMRVLFDVLKKDSSFGDNLGGLGPLFGAPQLKEWVDVSLLPPFDKIAKYFYFSVYSGGATPDGLIFKVFEPVPPQLKK